MRRATSAAVATLLCACTADQLSPSASPPPATAESATAVPPTDAPPSTAALAKTAPIDAVPPSPLLAESGWNMAGGGRSVYAVRSDPKTLRDGHATLLLTASGDAGNRYGTWERDLDARPYRGKRVRISALVATRGATHRADFWARVQGADSPGDGLGLGGQQVLISPTSPWTRYEIVMDVDPAGVWLQYAVGVAGPGELWLDAAKVEIVGNDVPVTNGSSRRTSK